MIQAQWKKPSTSASTSSSCMAAVCLPPARRAARSTAAPSTQRSTPGSGGDDPQFMGLYNCAGIPTKENNWTGQNYPGWCNKDADEALQAVRERTPRSPCRATSASRTSKRSSRPGPRTCRSSRCSSNTRAVPVSRTGFKNYKPRPDPMRQMRLERVAVGVEQVRTAPGTQRSHDSPDTFAECQGSGQRYSGTCIQSAARTYYDRTKRLPWRLPTSASLAQDALSQVDRRTGMTNFHHPAGLSILHPAVLHLDVDLCDPQHCAGRPV